MTVTSVEPVRDRGSGTRDAGLGEDRVGTRLRHAAVARQEHVDRVRRAASPGTWPRARASASTTSARPPVLAHGSHSAARNATRSRHARMVVGPRGPVPDERQRRATKPVTSHGPTRYHARAWTPSASRRSRLPSFPLPPRLEGLRRLAYNLHWAWHPRTRNLWSLVDRTAWNRYRNPVPVISGPTEWSRLLDDEKFMAEYQDVLADFDRYMADGTGHWFHQRYGDRARRADRLLLRGIRHPRIARHLLGRPRGACRRPHEIGQRHGAPVRRRRAAVPEGLLPPVDRCRRPPGARLPGLRPEPAAAGAGPGPERAAADREHRAPGS